GTFMKIFPYPMSGSPALLQRSNIVPEESSTGPFQEKKPALRRQRILWRRRVGDASAKQTSAVKPVGRCDFITGPGTICSFLLTETSECFHPVPLTWSKRRFVSSL